MNGGRRSIYSIYVSSTALAAGRKIREGGLRPAKSYADLAQAALAAAAMAEKMREKEGGGRAPAILVAVDPAAVERIRGLDRDALLAAAALAEAASARAPLARLGGDAMLYTYSHMGTESLLSALVGALRAAASGGQYPAGAATLSGIDRRTAMLEAEMAKATAAAAIAAAAAALGKPRVAEQLIRELALDDVAFTRARLLYVAGSRQLMHNELRVCTRLCRHVKTVPLFVPVLVVEAVAGGTPVEVTLPLSMVLRELLMRPGVNPHALARLVVISTYVFEALNATKKGEITQVRERRLIGLRPAKVFLEASLGGRGAATASYALEQLFSRAHKLLVAMRERLATRLLDESLRRTERIEIDKPRCLCWSSEKSKERLGDEAFEAIMGNLAKAAETLPATCRVYVKTARSATISCKAVPLYDMLALITSIIDSVPYSDYENSLKIELTLDSEDRSIPYIVARLSEYSDDVDVALDPAASRLLSNKPLPEKLIKYGFFPVYIVYPLWEIGEFRRKLEKQIDNTIANLAKIIIDTLYKKISEAAKYNTIVSAPSKSPYAYIMKIPSMISMNTGNFKIDTIINVDSTLSISVNNTPIQLIGMYGLSRDAYSPITIDKYSLRLSYIGMPVKIEDAAMMAERISEKALEEAMRTRANASAKVGSRREAGLHAK